MGRRMGEATETRRSLVVLVPLALIYSTRAFVCPLVRSPASLARTSLGDAIASAIASRSLPRQQQMPRRQCAPQPAPEDGTKEGDAAVGMGLDGDWQVVSGEVRLPAVASVVLWVLAVRFGGCTFMVLPPMNN